MIMHATLRAIVLATALAGSASWAMPAASDPDDMSAGAGLPAMQAMADNPEPIMLVLLLGGLLASLVLIRGAALRRAAQSVNRIPGDAPRS